MKRHGRRQTARERRTEWQRVAQRLRRLGWRVVGGRGVTIEYADPNRRGCSTSQHVRGARYEGTPHDFEWFL